ncbi:hypothetical protein NPIL_435611 [Nephila pilipes]|uniref:Uncharacterized protein n=1 Tax=Nephila pilipes TaxID=299642 RepID=A0A8X6PTM6_NEPPI|nr:hypothetical protein NPIL_435611 [Nephila pilipes]
MSKPGISIPSDRTRNKLKMKMLACGIPRSKLYHKSRMLVEKAADKDATFRYGAPFGEGPVSRPQIGAEILE